MTKLNVILRTCSNSELQNNLKDYVRICGNDREVMILKCLNSLISSLNLSTFNIELTIIDDNSDASFIEKVKSLLSKCNKPSKFISLTLRGFNHSAFEQFRLASECDDLVYVVEDDYLHEECAIDSMIMAHETLSKRFYSDIVMLFPFDCPFRYVRGKEEPTILLHDGKRYWRQTQHTSNTLFVKASVIKQNFEVFKKLALEYPNVTEEDTINKLYKSFIRPGGDITVFSPIPSLAYHLSYQPPALVGSDIHSWQELWDRF